MIDVTANGPYMMKRCYVYFVFLVFLQLWRFVEFFSFFLSKFICFLFDFVEKINLK